MTNQAENTMSAATDKGVLAVMLAADLELDWDSAHGEELHLQMIEARATVAELIDALGALDLREAVAVDSRQTNVVRTCSIEGINRIRAALARCGGAQ